MKPAVLLAALAGIVAAAPRARQAITDKTECSPAPIPADDGSSSPNSNDCRGIIEKFTTDTEAPVENLPTDDEWRVIQSDDKCSAWFITAEHEYAFVNQDIVDGYNSIYEICAESKDDHAIWGQVPVAGGKGFVMFAPPSSSA